MDLTLNLKGEYFAAIKCGEKTHEYRLVEKWHKRLLNSDGSQKTFDKLIICRGYPKKTDDKNRIVLPWRGFERMKIKHEHFSGTGPLFGLTPVDVFAIRCDVKEPTNG
jgi:ASC-1-like (ASCH) protein